MKPFLLVADAEPILRGMFHLYLSTKGFPADTAVGAFDCLEKLRRLRPDVLILDRDLPGNGAAEVLAQMRDGTSGLPWVPVILLSTSAFAEPDLVQPPIVSCLLKPFSLLRLAEAADSALSEFQKEIGSNVATSTAAHSWEKKALSSTVATYMSSLLANFPAGEGRT